MNLTERLQVWEEYYAALDAAYLFPNEFVVRTFLGRYPGLDLPHAYDGAKVLDVGCGDGRNLTLLHALGMGCTPRRSARPSANAPAPSWRPAPSRSPWTSGPV